MPIISRLIIYIDQLNKGYSLNQLFLLFPKPLIYVFSFKSTQCLSYYFNKFFPFTSKFIRKTKTFLRFGTGKSTFDLTISHTQTIYPRHLL